MTKLQKFLARGVVSVPLLIISLISIVTSVLIISNQANKTQFTFTPRAALPEGSNCTYKPKGVRQGKPGVCYSASFFKNNFTCTTIPVSDSGEADCEGGKRCYLKSSLDSSCRKTITEQSEGQRDIGQSCDVLLENCKSGLICATNSGGRAGTCKGKNGQQCFGQDSNCLSGNCVRDQGSLYLCQSQPGDEARAWGQSCTSKCVTGTTCRTASSGGKKCLKSNLNDTVSCEDKSECKSNICTNGKCQAKPKDPCAVTKDKPNACVCKTNTECKTNYCSRFETPKKCRNNPGGGGGDETGRGGGGTGGGGTTKKPTAKPTAKPTPAPKIKVQVKDTRGKLIAVQIGRAVCDANADKPNAVCTVDTRKNNIATHEFSRGTVPSGKEFVGAMINTSGKYKFKDAVGNPAGSKITRCHNQSANHSCFAWNAKSFKSGTRTVTFTIEPIPTGVPPTGVPPTLTPIPPTDEPTGTPGPTEPDTTVTPGPTEPAATATEEPREEVDMKLNILVRFQGITSKPSEVNEILARVKIMDKRGFSDEHEVEFQAQSDGKWKGTADIKAPEGETYKILIKGGKHLQKKVCDKTPTELRPAIYSCGDGNMALVTGENNLDFTGIRLIAGDLPLDGDQDGLVDSEDLTFIRQNLGSKDDDVLEVADLNLDDIVDSQDFSLVIAGLSVKTDEQ